MKTRIIITLLSTLALATGCSNDLESGAGYPALEMGDTTLVYKIDKVMQNDVDVKPYFDFFDQVELTLSYKDNQPYKLTFEETGAPFHVTPYDYTGSLEFEWVINTSKTPYEIRFKDTGEVFCYISRDRMVTFPFQLGCPSNKYEYQLLPVEE